MYSTVFKSAYNAYIAVNVGIYASENYNMISEFRICIIQVVIMYHTNIYIYDTGSNSII